MKILVDADALVAIAKINDSNHRKALEIASWHKKDILRISPDAIGEAVTVLSNKVSYQIACDFLVNIRKSNLIELAVNKGIVSIADEVFLKQMKKHTSWFDCLNVALYRYYHMEAIFSFDLF